jgi:TrmH family RNA methyltransferase
MTSARRITSRDNPLLREVAQLAHSARDRRRAGRSVLEGIHLCEAYLQQPLHWRPHLAIVSDSGAAHPQVSPLLLAHGLDPIRVTDELFATLSTLQQGVGIAFVIDTPRLDLPDILHDDLVFLDRVQDPGNVGTLLRNCAAAGVGTVVTAPGTAWCWSPKVLRAGMGAHFHVRIHEAVPWSTLRPRITGRIVGTRVQPAHSLYDTDLRGPTAWLFGSEGEGLSPEVTPDVQAWVGIPQQTGVESLNVAAAAAVCLFEQRRQRLHR